MNSTTRTNLALAAISLLLVWVGVDAFVAPSPAKAVGQRATLLFESAAQGATGASEETLENYLQSNYPLFESLLISKIPSIYKTLESSPEGYTIFAPSNSVMENVDDKRKVQISDPRNEEITEKLASYHLIPNGKVTWERLKREDWTVPKVDGVAALSIGGVLTMAGELRVGRSKSGGFMGFGAKEDGGVVIGNNEAKIVKSTTVGNGIVHEVDGFVAPDLIWRYFDQLRIPLIG